MSLKHLNLALKFILMKKLTLSWIIAGIFGVTNLIGQHQLILDSIYSPNLKETKKFYVLAPKDFETKTYPVLYLLHGAWGGYKNWVEKTQISNHVHSIPVVLVFPDAGNSFYVNSVKFPERKFTDYILKDLLSYVEEKYNIDTLKRGIAGLSMGGYGAFYLASRAPQRFIFSAGLSSAFSVPGQRYDGLSESELKNPLVQMLIGAFGEPDSEVYPQFYPPEIAKTISTDKLPYFYFAHGIQDGYKDFLPAHRLLAEVLSERNIPYEYHEVPGKHDWEFWDTHVQPVLAKFLSLSNQ